MNDEEKIKELVSQTTPLGIRMELFRAGNFDFIVKGKDEFGMEVTHEKQKKALKILRDDTTNVLIYGGGAGSGKTVLGCNWLLFMCLLYPGTRWYVARNELKTIVGTVYQTFKDICKKYGFEDYKFNAVKNILTFGNGSTIDLLEIKTQPSDPYHEDLGSYEFTGGWIEEAGEIDYEGAKAIRGRTGRWKNVEFGIKQKLFITCNPKKNWVYTEYYKPFTRNELPENVIFLPALIVDNPFMGLEWIEQLRQTYKNDKLNRARLLEGNWEYETNENSLCEYEMIEQIFKNNHVEQGRTYITADIARLGSDKARIGVWRGWRLIYVKSFDVSKTTDIQDAINLLRRKYQIPKNKCIADEDAVGGGVVDNCGILGFNNGGKVIKERGVYRERKDAPQYRNIQVQCLFKLADKVNEGGLWIMADLTGEEKEEIKEELDQIQSIESDQNKLDLKRKSEIKKDIGRSPDWRDMLLMRVYFDLKSNNTVDLVTNWS